MWLGVIVTYLCYRDLNSACYLRVTRGGHRWYFCICNSATDYLVTMLWLGLWCDKQVICVDLCAVIVSVELRTRVFLVGRTVCLVVEEKYVIYVVLRRNLRMVWALKRIKVTFTFLRIGTNNVCTCCKTHYKNSKTCGRAAYRCIPRV